MLNILFIPAEIDAYLARSETLKAEWNKHAAEFEEALAVYEATYEHMDEVRSLPPLHQPTSPEQGAEEPTTSSRTSECLGNQSGTGCVFTSE